MTRARPVWPAVLAAVAALSLLAAVAVERGLGIAPCELCLLERWPWRVALAAGLAALLLPAARRAGRAVAIGAMLVSVALAILHGGVERGFWPSPFPSCRAPALTGGTLGAQIAALPARAAKPCDAATYLVAPLPVSMADANGLVSAAVLVLLLATGKEKRTWRTR